MLDIPSKDSIIVPSSAIEKIAEIEKVKSFLAVLALVRSPYCSEVQDSSLAVSDIFVDKKRFLFAYVSFYLDERYCTLLKYELTD